MKILIELPARVHGLDWYMIFSTETHGFSLNQLYRRSIEFNNDLPALLIVKDVDQNVNKMKDLLKKYISLYDYLDIWCICTSSINNK